MHKTPIYTSYFLTCMDVGASWGGGVILWEEATGIFEKRPQLSEQVNTIPWLSHTTLSITRINSGRSSEKQMC